MEIVKTEPVELSAFNDWTRYDDALAESLRNAEVHGHTARLLPLFDAYAERLSDGAFWYLLGAVWSRYASMTDNALWLKHFGAKRPYRAVGLMKPAELEVLSGLSAYVGAYRPQTKSGGLHPFIFCADIQTAIRHAAAYDSEFIGTYSVPSKTVVAYFERWRGPEILVLDCSDVRLETVVPNTMRI